MLTEKDLQFNKGTATWKGKMLRDMSREEIYDAFNELGKMYLDAIKNL